MSRARSFACVVSALLCVVGCYASYERDSTDAAPASLDAGAAATVRSPLGCGGASTHDVNGDGFDDLVMSAGSSLGHVGAAYLYLSSAAGLSTSSASRLVGPPGSGAFAERIAIAGDVDRDGFADVVVGDSSADDGAGAAYLYAGSPAGWSATPRATFAPMRTEFGWSVASAGDVNGDGFDDIVVGANHGAYVYLGGGAGIGATPVVLQFRDISDGGSPTAVSSADVNGDGLDDVVVGEYYAGLGVGRVYVYLGDRSGIVPSPASTLERPPSAVGDFAAVVAGAGDLNGDGFGDVAVTAGSVSGPGQLYIYLGSASGLSTSPATVVPGPTDGTSSVACAGDVNGDGLTDLVSGFATEMDGESDRVNIFWGNPRGVTAITPTTLLPPSADIHDPIVSFGYSIATRSDLDHDGYDDVVFSAAHDVVPIGRVFIYRGTARGVAPDATLEVVGNVVDPGFGGSVD